MTGEEIKEKKEYDQNADTNPSYVCEPATAYQATPQIKRVFSRIGDKTIEDYLPLPEGTRIELIDGYLFEMAAPTTIHQSVSAEIHHALKMYIDKKGGSCVPFYAPVDVQLDCDDKTMVQPDVFVVCDRSKITKTRIIGAPDLIMEIVSPNHTAMDTAVKLMKYKYAGVREYWIVFPDEKAVIVYNFTDSMKMNLYSFDDIVPVSIWDGECEVDFSHVYKQIEFMY